jgi:hypothetical protein
MQMRLSASDAANTVFAQNRLRIGAGRATIRQELFRFFSRDATDETIP